MTITFEFFGFLDWNWLGWIVFILLTLTYLFLILGSKDLKKNNYDSTTLLFISGILLLACYLLLRLIIPSMVLSSYMPPTELFLHNLYNLLFRYSIFAIPSSQTGGIFYIAFQIILGIGFINVGSKNRDQGGTVMLVGGILYLITWIIDLITILSFIIGFSFPLFVALILAVTAYILPIVAAILILIFSISTKRALFIVFGALFLNFYSIQFLIFIL
ncbi:MAG: hypothetical protein ACFE9P_01910 [Candidatus Hermodarchaeota archaeon]